MQKTRGLQWQHKKQQANTLTPRLSVNMSQAVFALMLAVLGHEKSREISPKKVPRSMLANTVCPSSATTSTTPLWRKNMLSPFSY